MLSAKELFTKLSLNEVWGQKYRIPSTCKTVDEIKQSIMYNFMFWNTESLFLDAAWFHI